MNIVLMQKKTDCEVAQIATATGKTYAEALKALGYKDLPGDLENPIYGNPLNLHKALLYLGFWKINRTLEDIINGRCTNGKTIILVKNSILMQHWVTLASVSNGLIGLYWGDKAEPRYYNVVQFAEMFNNGGENLKDYQGPIKEAFEVYKCGFFELIKRRIKNWFK